MSPSAAPVAAVILASTSATTASATVSGTSPSKVTWMPGILVGEAEPRPRRLRCDDPFSPRRGGMSIEDGRSAGPRIDRGRGRSRSAVGTADGDTPRKAPGQVFQVDGEPDPTRTMAGYHLPEPRADTGPAPEGVILASDASSRASGSPSHLEAARPDGSAPCLALLFFGAVLAAGQRLLDGLKDGEMGDGKPGVRRGRGCHPGDLVDGGLASTAMKDAVAPDIEISLVMGDPCSGCAGSAGGGARRAYRSRPSRSVESSHGSVRPRGAEGAVVLANRSGRVRRGDR